MDETAQLHEKLLAMNEALLLGSVRQHELTQEAEKLNGQLRQTIIQGQETAEKLAVSARELTEKARLLDLSNDAIIVHDLDDRISLWNKGAEKLFGWTSGEVIGERIHSLLQTEFSKPIKEIREQLHAEGKTSVEVIQTARDGRRMSLLCRKVLDRDTQSILTSYTDITERRQAEAALRGSEARYRTLFDSMDEGFCVIEKVESGPGQPIDFRYIEINPAFAVKSGIRDAIGKTIRQVVPEEPEDWFETYEAVLRTGEAIRFERGLASHGRVLDLYAVRVEDGTDRRVAVIFNDITERKLTEEALRASEAKFRDVADNIPQLAWLAGTAGEGEGEGEGEGGNMRWFNRGWLDYTGTTLEENVGFGWNKMLHPDHGEVVMEKLARHMREGRDWEDTFPLRGKDGSYRWFLSRMKAIRDASGKIVRFFGTNTDVTEQRLLEERLRETTAVAEQANLAKSVFLSRMSHELRTPLNAILGFAQLIDSGSPQPTPSQKRSVDCILDGGWFLLKLINEILDLAQIESGKLLLSMEPVSLSGVMHECQDMIEPLMQKRGIGVAFPKFEVPYFVQADRIRIKQVLINLLSNAIKYNRGNGTVVVECSASAPGRIRISVKDTGVGLTPDELTQLFQPFNRLGQEANAEEGTGIGLVVCKRLIESMGGAIGVESTVGMGSVFWIEMNLAAEPRLAGLAKFTAPAQAPIQAEAPLRTVLCVEDNRANQRLIKALIASRPDIRLLSAGDGNRGVEIARALQPDVILMDIQLPGISGIEALKLLADDPTTAHIPVIALTANAMPHDVEKGVAAGFFRYLTKPIQIKEFMATLDVALEFAQQHANPQQSHPTQSIHPDQATKT